MTGLKSITWVCRRCGEESDKGSFKYPPKGWGWLEILSGDREHSAAPSLCHGCMDDLRKWWGEKK